MPPQQKCDPRQLMEMAIEVMKQSVCEPRGDGKACPLVGAVLWKPDGSVETACRGELRYGDHAEYTLLERKNRSTRLDGCFLFATLEPCAPGSRRHPKMGCAERIVAARIKEVWVGLEDPDPTVDRKGIKYLQDSGVTVHMFDRDLQEIISEENREFFDQALERAAEKKTPREVTLSKFERVEPTVTLPDLSIEALEQYRAVAKIPDRVDSREFRRRLLRQGLLKEAGKTVSPTGFGLLLFGKEPRTALPQAGLLGTIDYPDGTEETADFDGPIVLIPGLAEAWLRSKLPNVIDRSRMMRQEAPALPFEVIREAVVNALVHRDYGIEGAKCQLLVTSDTVTVRSPGGPLAPITLEQLQSFSAPMLSRNPQLHYVFARMKLAEERGLGMKSLKVRCEEAGLPTPKYTWVAPYLTLTLYRNPAAAARAVAEKFLGGMTDQERTALEFFVSKPSITQGEFAARFGLTARTAQRRLAHFVDLGVLRRVGRGPTTKYEVVA